MTPEQRMQSNARLRMFGLVRDHRRGTVEHADMTTSMCDARVALSAALGLPCDRNGYARKMSDTP